MVEGLTGVDLIEAIKKLPPIKRDQHQQANGQGDEVKSNETAPSGEGTEVSPETSSKDEGS